MDESESILRPPLTSHGGHKPEQHPRSILPPRYRAKRSTATRAPTKTSTGMGKIYQVIVHGLRGEKMMIDLCNTEEQMKSMTVQQLKEKIAQKLPGNPGLDTLRLIFTDKHLEGDSDLLSEYGIQQQSVIHLVIRVPGGLTA